MMIDTKLFKLDDEQVLEFVLIPAGRFLMGVTFEPLMPQRNVEIPRGFWFGKYPVTQSQWTGIMGINMSRFVGDQHPVDSVSWNDCQEFIARLNEFKQGSFRLPYEAEWEYACRAGADGDFCFGNAREKLGEYAWYLKETTCPVGTKESNDWGLYDIHGNIGEWCEDICQETYAGTFMEEDASALTISELRSIRGGSWAHSAASCRSAIGGGYEVGDTLPFSGLRLVLELFI